MRTRAGLSAALLLLSTLTLTGCQLYVEDMCADGQLPAWRPDGPGKSCFQDGAQPTPGYVGYPEGDVPETTEDDYEPLERYPELKPWAQEYVAWQEAGAEGEPPAMPSVETE